MDEQAFPSDDEDIHFLFQPLREIINRASSDNESTEQVVERILRFLDKKRLVSYAPKNQVQLLNSHGRILVAILEDPGITQRALSQYIGVSESNVNASVKLLLKNNLITKTKIKNKNQYFFNEKQGLEHSDISRFLHTLLPYVKDAANKRQSQDD